MNNMKIFIAGPRMVSGLTNEIEDRLYGICMKGYSILVGDASGVDKAVQQYFTRLEYSNVLVYASNGKARNNLGNWHVEAVPVPANVTGFEFYAMKDRAMATDADYGFMIWNGESRGTLNNIVNLLNNNKKTLVYFTPKNSFICVDNFYKLEQLLINCHNGTKSLFHKLYKKTNEKGVNRWTVNATSF